MKNEQDILNIIKEDAWMMDVLRVAKSLNLPDWWICAGFVRSKIWDNLHGFAERTSTPDVDVIYFDTANIDEMEEKKYEDLLREISPRIPWSVKNQARMHILNNLPPFSSSVDAISKFPETATALGLKLDERDQLVLAAPWGIHDLLHLQLKPTPYYTEDRKLVNIYEERLLKKNWKSLWSQITVHHIKKNQNSERMI
ncbi:nucleotidyltransferase family protein [Peribacillus sp. SCS-37]|uniref:nucleotidyltransferase family protein n=1 Tax=Paraperibacillus esterisolvens TaxID=3115296 RepID=UPI003905AF1F